MKTYKLNDGQQITAEDNEEFVNKLNALSFFGYNEDIGKFMFEASLRCYQQGGKAVRVDSVDEFVDDLVKYGFVEINQNL